MGLKELETSIPDGASWGMLAYPRMHEHQAVTFTKSMQLFNVVQSWFCFPGSSRKTDMSLMQVIQRKPNYTAQLKLLTVGKNRAIFCTVSQAGSGSRSSSVMTRRSLGHAYS